EGGERVSLKIPTLPKPHSEFFIIQDNKGNPIPNQPYLITTSDGQKIKGVTDDGGKTQTVYTMRPEQIMLDILEYADDTMPYHQMTGETYRGEK
ncbi:hypothetical protein, partial [Moraxella bovis]